MKADKDARAVISHGEPARVAAESAGRGAGAHRIVNQLFDQE